MYREELINGNQFAEFSFNIVKQAANLGYDLSLYQQTADNKSHYSVGHMIPLTEKLFYEHKLTGGVRRDILNDLFRQDMIYRGLNGSQEI